MINIKDNNVLVDLKTYDDCFFNTIFTDPPYNLGSTWIIDKNGKPVIKQAQDFMNKWNALTHDDWNGYFKECFRVLKYGGYCLMFGIDRQMFAIQYYAMKNGFEIQQSLYWYFISSFPKATDVSKMIDKRLGCEREVIDKVKGMGKQNPEFNGTAQGRKENYLKPEYNLTAPLSDLAKQFDGYKYSISPLKQTVETIMVFRKPTKNKSVLDDIFAWKDGDEEISPSVLNIDGGRVPIDENIDDKRLGGKGKWKTDKCAKRVYGGSYAGNNIERSKIGRYPAQTFMDKETSEVIDEQSGKLKSGDNCIRQKEGFFMEHGGLGKTGDIQITYGDEGGASRICHTCKYEQEEIDLLNYEPKVSSKERNTGANEITHPTLKPIQLCKHVMTLFKLPDEVNQTVYIPFAGVFSEVIGIYKSGIKEENIYACEINTKWIKIGKSRFEFWKNKDLSQIKKEKILDTQFKLKGSLRSLKKIT